MVSEEVQPADEHLVTLCRGGSLEAFNELVDRHQGAVYGLCLRLLGSPQAAEDATQEAFLSAYRAVHSFSGSNVRGWLLRIAANESKDELRRRRRKDSGRSLDEMFDREGAPIEVPDASPGAEQLVEQVELQAGLQRALDRLPFDQRQAVVLSDVYGYRYDEIVEMTGASLGTVKSRIHRGRERLRTLLLEEPELFGRVRRSE
jgi:RNA polymerase sigma-70 factor (ECF subfamily)